MRRLITALLASAAVAAPGQAKAQLGVDFTGYNGSLGFEHYTMGFHFNVVNPILVTHLAYFDSNKDGLGANHTIGLWDSSGALLTSAFLAAGAIAPLDGFYRLVAITPLLLGAGADYAIGGTTAGDGWVGSNFSNFTGVTTNPDIEVTRAAWTPGTFLQRPTSTHEVNPPPFYGGGNFYAVTAPSVVPEPLSMMLLGTGLAGIAVVRRRRRIQNG